MLPAFHVAPQAPDVIGCGFGRRRGEHRFAAGRGVGKRDPLVHDAGELEWRSPDPATYFRRRNCCLFYQVPGGGDTWWATQDFW